MLLNAAKREVTAFTLSKLLMENQQSGGGGVVKLPPSRPRLDLKIIKINIWAEIVPKSKSC